MLYFLIINTVTVFNLHKSYSYSYRYSVCMRFIWGELYIAFLGSPLPGSWCGHVQVSGGGLHLGSRSWCRISLCSKLGYRMCWVSPDMKNIKGGTFSQFGVCVKNEEEQGQKVFWSPRARAKPSETRSVD